jgi:hypothetical protein
MARGNVMYAFREPRPAMATHQCSATGQGNGRRKRPAREALLGASPGRASAFSALAPRIAPRRPIHASARPAAETSVDSPRFRREPHAGERAPATARANASTARRATRPARATSRTPATRTGNGRLRRRAAGQRRTAWLGSALRQYAAMESWIRVSNATMATRPPVMAARGANTGNT